MKAVKNVDSFGRRLRHFRQEKGLSQGKLAEMIGSDHKVISRYERGESKPSIETALVLAKALETTVGYLLGETNQHDRELEIIFRDLSEVSPKEQQELKNLFSVLIGEKRRQSRHAATESSK